MTNTITFDRQPLFPLAYNFPRVVVFFSFPTLAGDLRRIPGSDNEPPRSLFPQLRNLRILRVRSIITVWRRVGSVGAATIPPDF
jgi:hypothetical protein